ncbi:hypothetical protein GOARA_027_00470 [Gordonia araii NBRC 100433]|uniref:Uncharacterized protein n=1 Tax=Gordonia araii NBRC 100433 TaxID=1073574 RepID=G7GZQ9_9ACTN|nr:hypothetical protein [Gordonia araii]NNG98854.1 hypothetical protein [Gordonia araii NBRC 100433]GAB09084.1 hypothetical protein GOARA_027_00470 [Gordonia araii NBRC 100433]
MGAKHGAGRSTIDSLKQKARKGVSSVVIGLAGLLTLSGCSAIDGDAPLPNDKGTISVNNPIERSQTGDVTTEGHAITARLVDALVKGGLVVGDSSFQAWDTCTSAKQFAVGYNPRNGIRYMAHIYLTPRTDIAKPTRLVQDIGEGWETKDDSSKGEYGVFSLSLSIINKVQLLVVSPCTSCTRPARTGYPSTRSAPWVVSYGSRGSNDRRNARSLQAVVQRRFSPRR